MFTEAEVTSFRPAVLRYHEAERFRASYAKACGPPRDDYFGMIAELDAFLWAISSIRDLSSPTERQQLEASDVFLLLIGLRHVTTHQAVLASPTHASLPGRPVSRVIDEDIARATASVQLRLDVVKCEEMLDAAANNHPGGRKGYQAAKKYLNSLRSSGNLTPPLATILDEGLVAAKKALGL